MKIGICSILLSVMSVLSFGVYCCFVVGAQEDEKMEMLQKEVSQKRD